ncbi:hypothetical protein [Lactobacillus crispatus]
MSRDQNPMGMPIKRRYSPDQQVSEKEFEEAEENELPRQDS